jgi:uncharacterized membrane protein YdbT with pleckstrin-like domain
MSYLDEHLLDGEQIVYRAHLHWIIFAPAIAGVALGATVGLMLQVTQRDYWYVGVAIAGIGLLLAIGPAIRYITSEFAVTNKRVLGKIGFIERESDETLLSKVEAVGVDQGIMGRLLGYGTVTITGTGGTQEPFAMISDPLEFRRQIQTQVVATDERRVQPSTSTAGSIEARVERDCPYCAERILARARVCKHCGRDVVPATG